MSETPEGQPATTSPQQIDFEKISGLVSTEFQVEEALLENNVPTYYLKQPQETKNAFLKLFKNLKSTNLMPILRRVDGRIVLRIVAKPPVKPSNILINWILFFATIGTTFYTGYQYVLLTGMTEFINPLVGGIAFMVAIMAVLGVHEMGHKLTANKKQIEATPPYFIPGPPPIGDFLGIGTFGAVIMQKSLPPNKDSLFDIGSSGPLVGFIISVIAVFVGLLLSPSRYALPVGPFMSVPLFFQLAATSLSYLGIATSGNIILLHPVAFAGMIGMIVTMLNLLPTGMLDGGHVARSISGDKVRGVLTIASLIFLVWNEYYPMAIFVLFLSLFRHPGPLDDVSSLSRARKAIIPILLIIFVLCGMMISSPVHQLTVDSNLSEVKFRIYYAGSMYDNETTTMTNVWTEVLAEETYIVSFDPRYTQNGTVYKFDRWEDGTTNPNRTVILNQDFSIKAFYLNTTVPM